ncbi:MAG: hypothetical protein CMO11_03370 [Thaumarchaeota archaeon]|nr:hypothetical protein [Nitrososphaerota archaeon]|tara:strand:+ start:361 stop:972 length:612 start_codon:yes stop_codon:yes gene_type:complete
MNDDTKRGKKREKNQRRLARKQGRQRSKQLKKIRNYAILGLVVFGIGYMLYGIFSAPQIGPIGSTHQHIDLLIHVDGQIIDLNQTQYAHQSNYAHLHQNETDVIHLHAINIPLSWFMDSLNIPITDSSLTLDGQTYNEDELNKLHIIINGEEIDDIEYVLQDEDKLLVLYGPENEEEIEEIIELIPDRARVVNARAPDENVGS